MSTAGLSKEYAASIKTLIEKIYPEPRKCNLNLDGLVYWNENKLRGLRKIADAFGVEILGLGELKASEGLRRSEPSF